MTGGQAHTHTPAASLTALLDFNQIMQMFAANAASAAQDQNVIRENAAQDQSAIRELRTTVTEAVKAVKSNAATVDALISKIG